ncbi:MAG: hypothetical protein ACF8AM_20080, partial [Rhodopirellula sp. JB055]|uniref:hypothetical protein n=1 Tax=Rhodopirellula sp. JB055 TaxID=3342846 RepID=UPI00370AFCBC
GRLPLRCCSHVGRDDTPVKFSDVASALVDTLATGCHASGNAQQFGLLARFKITEELQELRFLIAPDWC